MGFVWIFLGKNCSITLDITQVNTSLYLYLLIHSFIHSLTREQTPPDVFQASCIIIILVSDLLDLCVIRGSCKHVCSLQKPIVMPVRYLSLSLFYFSFKTDNYVEVVLCC